MKKKKKKKKKKNTPAPTAIYFVLDMPKLLFSPEQPSFKRTEAYHDFFSNRSMIYKSVWIWWKFYRVQRAQIILIIPDDSMLWGALFTYYAENMHSRHTLNEENTVQYRLLFHHKK
jgi:hypothetical protein